MNDFMQNVHHEGRIKFPNLASPWMFYSFHILYQIYGVSWSRLKCYYLRFEIGRVKRVKLDVSMVVLSIF